MTTNIGPLLQSYPRARPPLPSRLRDIYEDIYLASRNGRSLLYRITQRLERWMHKQVAADSRPGQHVLEIGAGTLNHVLWEARQSAYDVVEPFTALYADRPEVARVNTFYHDMSEVPAEKRYDRIFSIATLEHVLDLPRVVAQAAMHLHDGGTLAAAIPSEGGVLWGASWRLTVGLAFRLRTGLNYGDLMRHEHVSKAKEIVAVLSHLFGHVRIRRYPTPASHLSLYAFIRCEQPDCHRCAKVLTGGID